MANDKRYPVNIRIVLLSLLIPVLFFLTSLYTINDYGETTDEKFDQHIGEFYYYQWQEKGVKGLEERFIPLQRNYGPFFDKIAVASNDILYKKLNIIKNSVASYHFPVIIVSTIVIWIVFVFSYYNWGIMPAILSSLTLAFLPRFIGDSQNNLKDTPLMTFFSISLFLYYFSILKNKVGFYILAGVFLGLTYAIKINALIIIPIITLWYLLINKLNLKKSVYFVINFGISLLAAFSTILFVWPYYRYNTLYRFIETYLTFKNHVWNEYILYLGQLYRGHEVPWHYPIIMFGVTIPIFYLFFLILGIFMSFYLINKNTVHKKPLIFLLLWLIFPPMTQIISRAPMYDGIRHFLVILPPISILAGFAIYRFGIFVKKLFNKNLSIYYIYVLAIFIGYWNILLVNVRLHPYQIVFFNALTGGIKGAYDKFDLDYWGSSLKEAAEWINNNLPTGSRIYMPLHMEHHFPIDKSRFIFVNDNPDYKVNIVRGMLKTWDPEEKDYLHPSKKPIYSVKIDGVSVLNIFKY